MSSTILMWPSDNQFRSLFGLLKNVDVFSAMTEGAADGLRTVVRIFPTLVALLSAVYC